MSACVVPAKRRKLPKYAVVTIHETSNVNDLFSLLIGGGFSNVTFLSDLSEHADVQLYLRDAGCSTKTTTQDASRETISTATDSSERQESALENVVNLGEPSTSASSPALIDDTSSMCSFKDNTQSETRAQPRTEIEVHSESVHDRMGPSKANRASDFSSVNVSRGPNEVLGRSIEDVNVKSEYPSQQSSSDVTMIGFSDENFGEVQSTSRISETVSPAPAGNSEAKHEYVVCRLCNNRIRCTRHSNMLNHVRRHGAVKQFQCAHCSYEHNELSKVRLHMLNNHGDTVSQPVDTFTPAMQDMWDQLMLKCFPDNVIEPRMGMGMGSILGDIRPTYVMSKTPQGIKGGDKSKRAKSGPPVGVVQTHVCKLCSACLTSTTSSLEDLPAVNIFELHLKMCHLSECVAYQCDECRYVNVEQWKVRWHISMRHPDNAGHVTVSSVPAGSNLRQFIVKYFPTVQGESQDTEDSYFFTKEKNHGQLIPSIMEGLDTDAGTSREIFSDVKMEVEDPVDEQDKEDFSSNLALNKANPSALRRTELLLSNCSDLGVISCNICGKLLDYSNKNALCPLMAHAKRHHDVKQFSCPHCSYECAEAVHVRSHLKMNHQNSDDAPINRTDLTMQTAWIQLMRQCFPRLGEKIDKFQFKTAKVGTTSDSGSNESNGVEHSYGTRKKASK